MEYLRDTLNSEKGALVPVGSFFDKIHCMCWSAHFLLSGKIIPRNHYIL